MITVHLREHNELLRDAIAYAIIGEQDLRLATAHKQTDVKPEESNERSVLVFGLEELTPMEEIRLLKEFCAKQRGTRVLVLTNTKDRLLEEMLFEAGADGIASKVLGKAELVSLIRATGAGYKTQPANHPMEARLEPLNATERKVVRLACAGAQRKDLANILATSESSVKRIVGSILSKTGHRSLGSLALEAISCGAINPRVDWNASNLTEMTTARKGN